MRSKALVYEGVALDRSPSARACVAPINGGAQSLITKLFDQVERASKAADLVNNADGVRKRSRVDDCVFR